MTIKRCGRMVKSFLNTPYLQIYTRWILPFSLMARSSLQCTGSVLPFGYGRTSLNTSCATYASSDARRGAPHNALLKFLRSVFALAASKQAAMTSTRSLRLLALARPKLLRLPALHTSTTSAAAGGDGGQGGGRNGFAFTTDRYPLAQRVSHTRRRNAFVSIPMFCCSHMYEV